MRRTSRKPRRRTSLRANDLHKDWDLVNFVQRQAEKSGDQRAVAAAKVDVRRVYELLQEERAKRTRRNPKRRGVPATGKMWPGWLVMMENQKDFVSRPFEDALFSGLVKGPWKAHDFGSKSAAVAFAKRIPGARAVYAADGSEGYTVHTDIDKMKSNPMSQLQQKYQRAVARYTSAAAAERDLAERLGGMVHKDSIDGEVLRVPSRSRSGQFSYAVMLWPTEKGVKAWLSAERVYQAEQAEFARPRRNPQLGAAHSFAVGDRVRHSDLFIKDFERMPNYDDLRLDQGTVTGFLDGGETVLVEWDIGDSIGKGSMAHPFNLAPLAEPLKRNVRLKASTELKIEESIAIVRAAHPAEQKAFLPASAWKRIVADGAGWYSYGSGPKRENVLRKYKTTDMGGAMTSARIGASRSGETHWLVDNRGSYPVVIRIFDALGKTVFRVEEYAKKLVGEAVYVEARRSKSGTR